MQLEASAFTLGLLGGVHCVAMCGGIVAALSLRRRPEPVAVGPDGAAVGASPTPVQLSLHGAYSIGRIASYGVAGAVAGAIGATAALFDTMLPAQAGIAVIAHGLVMLLGLHLAGLGQGVGALERLGAGLWRQLAPLGRRFLPADTPAKALAVGAVWGWLPCGLVYSALALALLSGSATRGAVIMFAFGAGTLPNVLLVGLTAARLGRILKTPGVRLGAGLLVLGLGAWGLVRTPGVIERVRDGLLCLT